MSAFCAALCARNYHELLYLGHPHLRGHWDNLLYWTRKLENRSATSSRPTRSGGPSVPVQADAHNVLRRMEESFCAAEVVFDLRGPYLCCVRKKSGDGQLPLRRIGGKWYVAFYEDMAQAEYMLALAAEIAKAECQKQGAAPRKEGAPGRGRARIEVQ